MRIVENSEDLYNSILKSDEVSVILFSGESCPPCKKIAIILKDIESSLNGRVKFLEATTRKTLSAFSKYNIVKVPTILFVSKEPLSSHIRVHAKLNMPDITRENIRCALGEYMRNPILR